MSCSVFSIPPMPMAMDSFFFFFFIILILSLSLSSPCRSSDISSTEFEYPNFTASHLNFANPSGTFLFSSNSIFKAAMFNPGTQNTARFYLCIIHVDSNTVTWSANRNSPVSESGTLTLTPAGITITHNNTDNQIIWSTPKLNSPVNAMRLTDSGNLLLLDSSNSSLWESFHYPTDTIVTGQLLNSSSVLSSSISGDNLSSGDYTLALTSSDVNLSWKGLVYWKMSMESKAYVNSNRAAKFLSVNRTGIYLYGSTGVVLSMDFPTSDFRIATLDYSGRFVVTSFPGARFARPIDECRVPFVCGKLGLCSRGLSSDTLSCSCPSSFRSNESTNVCVPSDGSYSLQTGSCNSTIDYLKLDDNVDYFATEFDQPFETGANLSDCQHSCTRDCACLGIFFANSSGSCYKIDNEFGSVISVTNNKLVGFVKTTVTKNTDEKNGDSFPGAKVILPSLAALFIFAIGFLLWRRIILSNVDDRNTEYDDPSFDDDDDLTFSIPGLPSRFSYEELVTATNNFVTQIGTGGYGTVYKGVLSDKTEVAVKRMTKFGPQGKSDFRTEIGVIGNIHHVNLVKLKGYCAQRNEWLLVYEYMSRGSLDKTLFGGNEGSVLEWRERVEIAIGAAHGLAYLHGGCEPKIIHCDVKPENILLGDHLQAKISDFGLAKFLGLEESSLIATMRGTRGYLAPEWLTRSTISDKTDVYSFGMVLIEIVSGRKNCVSSSEDGIIFFPLYALEMHKQGRYLELVDRKVRDRATNEDVGKLVRVALCCVHQEPELRPSMVSVVGMLEGEMPVGEPRIESLGFLKFYGPRGSEIPGMEQSEVIEEAYCSGADFSHSSSTKSTVLFNSLGFDHVSSEQVSGPR